MQKNNNVSFAKYEKGLIKAEKTEIKFEEYDEKLPPLIKGKNEKTISIKAPRSASYTAVVRLVDLAYGAGATTVYLLIDDMEE